MPAEPTCLVDWSVGSMERGRAAACRVENLLTGRRAPARRRSTAAAAVCSNGWWRSAHRVSS
jgi:hypothetical protein